MATEIGKLLSKLIDEYMHLDAKITKLDNALLNKAFMRKVSKTQKKFLKLQTITMTQYRDVLDLRINDIINVHKIKGMDDWYKENWSDYNQK